MANTYTMDLNEQQPANKFLLLKAREASIADIFRLLFSADIENKDFITLLKVKQTILERRGILALSMLAQKVIQKHEKCMSLFGSGFEMCLNILGNRTNLAMFLKSLLRGKVVLPDKMKASFLSTIGYLDNRVELDKDIKPGSNKYFATLCAMASKVAYENKEFIQVTVVKTWKMELLGTYSFWDERYQGETTQAFMFRYKNANPEMIVVAFRGTEPFSANDWSTDFDISWYKFRNIKGRVHGGFLKALIGLKQDGTWSKDIKTDKRRHAYNTITEDLKCHLKINHRAKFMVTGHSLGGALAVLFPALLVLHNETQILERLEAVNTFGQPRVGDAKFGRFMEEQFKHYGVRYYRFVYSHDIVPRMPFDDSALMFKHFGTCLYVNTLYQGKVVEEESFKNYFEYRAIVRKRVDAVWEVVRGFVLPHVYGAEYHEGLLQQMFRMMGLLFPGLSAHGMIDYINATRLATY